MRQFFRERKQLSEEQVNKGDKFPKKLYRWVGGRYNIDDYALSTELITLIGHRKEFLALALRHSLQTLALGQFTLVIQLITTKLSVTDSWTREKINFERC